MPRTKQRSNLLFPAISVSGFVFVVTVLVVIAASLGDPKSPVNQWIDSNASRIVSIEAAFVVCISVLAMLIDQCLMWMDARAATAERVSVSKAVSMQVPTATGAPTSLPATPSSSQELARTAGR